MVVDGRASGEPSSLRVKELLIRGASASSVCCLVGIAMLDDGPLCGHFGGSDILGAPPLVTWEVWWEP